MAYFVFSKKASFSLDINNIYKLIDTSFNSGCSIREIILKGKLPQIFISSLFNLKIVMVETEADITVAKNHM